jgi:hypothetical protein
MRPLHGKSGENNSYTFQMVLQPFHKCAESPKSIPSQHGKGAAQITVSDMHYSKVLVTQQHTATCYRERPAKLRYPKALFLGLKLAAAKCRLSYQIVIPVETETLDLSAVHSIHLGSKYDSITARSQQTVTKRTVKQSSPIYILLTQRLLLTFSTATRYCARLLNSLQNLNCLQGLKLLYIVHSVVLV